MKPDSWYGEQQAKRYYISNYVKGESQETWQEEKLQTGLRLIDMGWKDEDVLKSTLLNPGQLEEIKRNHNK
jgi:hypothetical protein